MFQVQGQSGTLNLELKTSSYLYFVPLNVLLLKYFMKDAIFLLRVVVLSISSSRIALSIYL